MEKLKKKLPAIIVLLVIILFIISQIILNIIVKNNLYNSLQSDIRNESWVSAKEKVEQLEQLGGYKDCKNLSKNVYYNYFKQKGDEEYSKKSFDTAMNNYKSAKQYKNINEINEKIKNTNFKIEEKKQQEILEQKRKEREEKIQTQRMLNNVVIIRQGFGYTQYGEKAVVGKIKNKNSFSVQVRADIDLKDSRGNVVGTTYTYDNIAPNSVWNFEAPTFNIPASYTYINLTVDKLN